MGALPGMFKRLGWAERGRWQGKAGGLGMVVVSPVPHSRPSPLTCYYSLL